VTLVLAISASIVSFSVLGVSISYFTDIEAWWITGKITDGLTAIMLSISKTKGL
jgi:hypothetical protein